MNKEIIARAGEIIAQNTGSKGHCVLALLDENGWPTASTISPAKAQGIEWITFCTGLTGNSAKRAQASSRACVCFSTGEYNISLVGTIEVLTDVATKQEMWYAGLENHFSGPDDPNFCVLRFQTRRYSIYMEGNAAKGTFIVRYYSANNNIHGSVQ